MGETSRYIIGIEGSGSWKTWKADGDCWIGSCDALGLTIESGTWRS